MKKILVLWFSVFLISCNSDSEIDCFKKQGDVIEKFAETDYFDKIHIGLNIELIVSQSDETKIKVEYGKNLIDNVHFEVENYELKITNKSNCSMLRNYHPAKVFVSIPNLVKIHSGSQYSVKSAGVLKFPSLLLESGIIEESLPISFFDIEVDNQELKINDNVSTAFRVSGKTEKLDIRFWSDAGRFEGENLIANEVAFYHRSSNDIIIYPITKVTGKLAGTGNLVLKNTPEILDVEQIYTGSVIYP